MRFPLLARSLRLFVVAVVVFFGSTTFASAQTCPGATPNDGSDDFTAIQNCLNAGGTVRLDDGYYWIGQTLELWHNNTILTNNGGGRPALLATPNLFGPILEVKGASYWELRDLQFGGMLYSRNFAYECGSGVHRKFGNNLFVKRQQLEDRQRRLRRRHVWKFARSGVRLELGDLQQQCEWEWSLVDGVRCQ